MLGADPHGISGFSVLLNEVLVHTLMTLAFLSHTHTPQYKRTIQITHLCVALFLNRREKKTAKIDCKEKFQKEIENVYMLPGFCVVDMSYLSGSVFL